MSKEHIPQSHTDTFLEQVAHTIAGMLTTFVFLVIFFPGVPFTTTGIGAIVVTAIKFAVHYYIRRWFAQKPRSAS